MKRRLTALFLTAVMVFGMIPASLLPVLAHGIGVGVNGIENLSIDNAPNQAIPATVTVDGSEDDTAWDHDDWQTADAGTGIWDANYYRSSDFSFKYQLHSDYQYIYGIVVLDTTKIYKGALGEVTVWLNSDASIGHYTAKIVFSDILNADGTAKGSGVTMTRSTYFGESPVEVSDPSETLNIESALKYAKIDEAGVLTIEFRTLTKTLTGKEQAAVTAYVSVETVYDDDGTEVTQTLYHPRFDAAIDANNIDPSAENGWPENAIHINQREIYNLSSADFSEVLPNEMVIDGKVTEAVWAPYTDMFISGLDRYEYRNTNASENEITGYNILDFDTVKYNANQHHYNGEWSGSTGANDAPIKYKYDIRYDKNYLYGAVVAYADYYDLLTAASNYGDNKEYYNVPLVLTLSYAQVGTDSDGKETFTHVGNDLVITNYTEVKKQSDYYYSVNNSWTGTCQFGSSDVGGGSTRVNRYLVQYEFAIPISSMGLSDNTEYVYAICVDTQQWGGTNEYMQSSEVHLLSGYYYQAKEEGHASYGNVFKKTTEVNTENWTPDGSLETTRWAAVAAADNIIDSMGRTSGKYASAEHMTYNVFTDDDYLYGIAVIEDSNWTLGAGTGSTAFNLWLNNGVPQWHDAYDNKLAFALDADGNTYVQLVNHYYESSWGSSLYNGTENMLTGIYNAYEDKTTAVTAVEDRGFSLYNKNSDGTFKSGSTYGQKWLVHPTREVYTQGVEAVMTTVKEEGTSRTVLLEFKLPLEMLCITEKSEEGSKSVAFSYVTSVGKIGGGAEMVHPMAQNDVLYGDTDRKNGKFEDGTSAYQALTFYPGCWNAHEVNFYQTNTDYTNNVADGKLQEDYWDQLEEMIYVDGDSGTWATLPTGDDYIDYYYNVYTTREWLYGAAVIDDTANVNDTKFTLWLNNDVTTTASTKATGRFDIYLDEDGEPVCEFYDASDVLVKRYTGVSAYTPTEVEQGAVLFNETEKRASNITGDGLDYTQESSYTTYNATVNYGYGSMKTINGVTYVEFKINLDKFVVDHSAHTKFVFEPNALDYLNIGEYYIEPRENYEYCVSVTHEGNELYYLGGENYKMWVSDVNVNFDNFGGIIVNDESLFSQINTDNLTTVENCADFGGGYAIFAPTRIDNVYSVVLMNWLDSYTWGQVADSATGKTYGDIWTEQLANLPEGAFIYKTRNNSSVNTMPTHMDWGWNKEGAAAADAIFDTLFKTGNYVEFHYFDPYAATVEDVAGVLSRDDISYVLRGYHNKAYFTSFTHPGDTLNDKQTAEYPDAAWTLDTDHTITPLENFVAEKVEVDGYLDDSGWDENKWIYVSNDVNGNMQNYADNKITTPKFEYKYQLRSDGEYVYVAALMDYDPDFTTATNGWESSPQFRIWIQSEGEGYDYNGNGTIDESESFDDAISFTHLFDVRLGASLDPNTNSTSWGGNLNTSINITKYDYTDANLPYEPVNEDMTTVPHVGAEGVTVTPNDEIMKLTYEGVTLRFASHSNTKGQEWWSAPNGGMNQTDNTATTMDQTNGFGLDSAFWGETELVAENTLSGEGVDYQSTWYAAPEVKKYVYGNEHAAYNTTEDGTQTVIEFKFKLSDIGTDSEHGFKYYVQCSSIGSTTTNAFVLFHPHYTIEPDLGSGYYSGYYYPFWVWGDNAFVCDEEWFYDNDLNNPTEPVTPLGSKYMEDYTTSGGKTWDSALKFGVLYTHEYVDDVYGRTDWTDEEDIYEDATYWDIKEIGMMICPSKKLSMTAENDVSLYTETQGATYAVSDLILRQRVDSCMADYENYIYYAIVNTSGHEADKLSFRGFVEYYPYDDIYYDHYWLPGSLESGSADEEGWSFRPTYYSNVISRTWDMVHEGFVNYGVNGNNMPESSDYIETPDKIDVGGTDTKLTVAYIPLDDRPVNDQRVQYLAQSAGITLLMPDEDLYSNTLDNNGNGTDDGYDSDSGNPKQLLAWLESIEAECHYYILSLDMLFSGGLIGSRAAEVDLDYDDEYDDGDDATTEDDYTIGAINATTGKYELSAGEQEILDYLVKLAADETKQVVYFDTVMRLASTTYYGEYTINDYTALRYAYANIARKQLYGADLTIEKIVAGYNKDENDNIISADGVNCAYSDTVSTNKVAQYLENRQRKLTIIDKLLTTVGSNGKKTIDNIESLILGVDDSMPQTTIQTNELRYIEEKLVEGRDNTVVMAAADELGLLGVSYIATEIFGKVKVNLEYFGDKKNEAADAYDKGTLNDTTKLHVKAAGGYFDYNEDGGMDVLVLTKADSTSELIANAKELLLKAQDNLDNDIPTCIVDASDNRGVLSALMFGSDFKNAGYSESDLETYALSDVGLLMGYSEWNTVSNALGVGLSNAIARYAYIQNAKEVTEESNYGFMKVITHAFVKDIAYRQNNTDGAEFYRRAPIITDKINASDIYVGEIGVEGSRVDGGITDVKVSDLYWPWDRHFEADFVISFTNSKNIALDATYTAPIIGEQTETVLNADLNDGVAANSRYNNNDNTDWYRFAGWTSYTDLWDPANDAWQGEAYSDGTWKRNVTFTFAEETKVGYVRVHVYTPDVSTYGISAPTGITVYGSNTNSESMSDWTVIGKINPEQSTDFNLPDGNSNPGTYYPFWPENSGNLGTVEGNVQSASWVTIPVESISEYKYIRVVFAGWGLQYINEVEVYEGDAEYDSSAYALPCEKTNFPYVNYEN